MGFAIADSVQFTDKKGEPRKLRRLLLPPRYPDDWNRMVA